MVMRSVRDVNDLADRRHTYNRIGKCLRMCDLDVVTSMGKLEWTDNGFRWHASILSMMN